MTRFLVCPAAAGLSERVGRRAGAALEIGNPSRPRAAARFGVVPRVNYLGMTILDAITGGLERATVLDRPAAAARKTVSTVLADRRIKDALHGVWLGHALHPALAQLTLGSLTSAAVLDLLGGRRQESSVLIRAGLLTAPLTVAAGWADYAESHEEQQRVGVVHAVTNASALALFATALVQRTRGRSGRTASVLGGTVAGVGAWLGGHLAYRQALGPNQAEAVPHTGPEDWQSLGPVAELPDGTAVQRRAGAVDVLVVRRGDEVSVLSDRCPHLAAPLHEGELDCASGEITCPWHGSVFRVGDGAVVHGPATAPVPGFATRVRDGVVEARVLTFPGVPAS
ncbi:Rieske (2Fe-2S) iron-sulfur domain protein [Pseudonocardia dioxanivorans CB1190]|uniref:Rieske (2Fe-2S) iron-sulfur domain protein n=1 Tax=Pseudonocardia dioxanivorans (strain ATCC 55486 / DSM 44775 / JCM 13855 / CB1190) TaxID=675635 RepID=F4D0S5_PSEUX|nr:Rieske (2Fe-2S) iron-sulfur domain protein [Pseudonocardia dioxanivorans CB1190]